MSKKGFAIIEVLVSFIILTSAISLLTYAQKNFNTTLYRLSNYENTYITLFSLKNKIDIELSLGDKLHYSGKINGINYTIDLKKILDRNNRAFDSMSGRYEKGIYTYTLYEVKIKLIEVNKFYKFYKLKTLLDENVLQNQPKEF